MMVITLGFGKVTHSSPYQPYDWDEDLTTLEDGSKAHIKDAKSYGEIHRPWNRKCQEAG